MGKKIKMIIIAIPIIGVLIYLGFIFLYTGTVNYELSEDGTYYVVKSVSDGPIRKNEEVEISETYKKLPVKGILWGALSNEAISSVTLPKTLEGINSVAFEGSAYYNNEASWEITYLQDGSGRELYRALYVSNYLIEVRYNDELIGENGTLPTVVVKDGTLGIAEGAFKSTNPDATYSTVSVKIESDDLSFVGIGAGAYRRSKGMFDIECGGYIIYYDGLMSDWNEFETEGVTHEAMYRIRCQDGVIDLTEEP